jgi:hypothetical protein
MQISHKFLNTSDINDVVLNDINQIFNSAFNSAEDYHSHFQWKYRDNPLGDSRHLMSYLDDRMVGVRSFWRTSDDPNLLQCVDTAISPSAQNLGVFGSGTRFLLEHENVKLYNFPNSKSFRQYTKYGWVIRQKLKPTVTTFNNAKRHCVNFETTEQFLNWRYVCHPRFQYRKCSTGSLNYVFRMKKGVPILLFKTVTDIDLPRLKPFFCVVYSNIPGFTIGFGNLTYAIARGAHLFDVEPHLMDML